MTASQAPPQRSIGEWVVLPRAALALTAGVILLSSCLTLLLYPFSQWAWAGALLTLGSGVGLLVAARRYPLLTARQLILVVLVAVLLGIEFVAAAVSGVNGEAYQTGGRSFLNVGYVTFGVDLALAFVLLPLAAAALVVGALILILRRSLPRPALFWIGAVLGTTALVWAWPLAAPVAVVSMIARASALRSQQTPAGEGPTPAP